MTVIRPNSVSGINSITVQSGNSLSVHKSDGTLIRTISGATGVSTFSSVSVGSGYTDNSASKSINIGVGASIAQHNDNSLTFGTNGDPRITIDASGNFNVGSAATIKAGGNATFSGIVTAASFIGDGSGLTGAGPTLTGSTNNTIVTVTGANAIQGESGLTFDGSTLNLSAASSNAGRISIFGHEGQDARLSLISDEGDDHIDQYGLRAAASDNRFYIEQFESGAFQERFTIKNGGNVSIGGTDANTFSNYRTLTIGGGGAVTGSGLDLERSDGNIYARFFGDADGVQIQAAQSGDSIRFEGAGGSEHARINGDGNLLVGSENARDLGGLSSQKIAIESTSGSACLGIINNQNSTGFPSLRFAKSRGSSVGSNTVVQSGDPLGGLVFCGADGTDMVSIGAQIICDVDGTPGSNDMPGRLEFHTTADGSATSTERMRIHSGGQVSMGQNSSYTNVVHDYQLVVTPNISDNSKGALGLLIDGEHGTSGGASVDSISLKVKNTNTWNNATHQYGGYFEVNQQLLQPQTGVYSQATGLYSTQKCFVAKLNKNLAAVATGDSYESIIVTTNSGGDAFHFRGYDDTTEKIRINKNGDIDNSNNSYGSLSDIKLKENIVDANSQWDDIKALKVRNFNFKDDPDKVKMLGLVAQEAEAVSAGLVKIDNDIEIDESTGEGTITGTTKYVKYSILYMKAVKALQEAQIRIETLETKVAALEGG